MKEEDYDISNLFYKDYEEWRNMWIGGAVDSSKLRVRIGWLTDTYILEKKKKRNVETEKYLSLYEAK